MTKFYNRYQDHNAQKTEETNKLEMIRGMAFYEVIAFIEDTISMSLENVVPIFKLQELATMYKKTMIANGTSLHEAELLHITRFKQQILEHVPCLTESKDGRSIILSLNSEIGQALFEACKSTSQDDGIILVKAANIIRHKLF